MVRNSAIIRQISCCMGMTLLETLIALMIFSIGILGVGTMLMKGIVNNTKARRVSFESLTIAERLETVLSLPYNDPLLVDQDNGFEPTKPDYGPETIPTIQSTIEWEIDDNFPALNTKRISITLRFVDHAGLETHYTYEYIKSKDLM